MIQIKQVIHSRILSEALVKTKLPIPFLKWNTPVSTPSRPMGYISGKIFFFFFTKMKNHRKWWYFNAGINTISFFNVCLMTIWLLGCQSFLTKCSVGLPNYIASESSGAADRFPNNF